MFLWEKKKERKSGRRRAGCRDLGPLRGNRRGGAGCWASRCDWEQEAFSLAGLKVRCYCLAANGSFACFLKETVESRVLREECTNSGTTTTRNVIFVPSAKFQTSSRQLEPTPHPAAAFHSFVSLVFLRQTCHSAVEMGFLCCRFFVACSVGRLKASASDFDGAPHCGGTWEMNDDLKRSSGPP